MRIKSIARWKQVAGLMLALLSLPPLAVWYIENAADIFGRYFVWVVGLTLYAGYAALVIWAGVKVWTYIRRLEADNTITRWQLLKIQQDDLEDVDAWLDRLRRQYERED